MIDDLPPLQNTLGSQPEPEGTGPPLQSLAEMMQDVADMDAAAAAPAAIAAAETADQGIALVTQGDFSSQGQQIA